MIFKNLRLNFFSSNIPCKITISTCDGNLIAQKTINSNFYSFCVCTNACCIFVQAKFNNQAITKKILLCDCKCKSYSINFNFVLPLPQPALQTITLVDANYGLPIKNAILGFNGYY